MFIANGRLLKDKNIGRMTCKESSLVDYWILAPEAFKIITEFEILDSYISLPYLYDVLLLHIVMCHECY